MLKAIVEDFPLDIHKQSQQVVINRDFLVTSRVWRAIVECHIHPVLQDGLNASFRETRYAESLGTIPRFERISAHRSIHAFDRASQDE
jgi:hypothetical protein